MVAPGQFSKDGDMIIEESYFGEGDWLISQDTYTEDYVEVEVPD